MKRLDAFRMLILFISISLLFDFFFITTEITEGKIISGLTLFDRAIIDKVPLEQYVLGSSINHNYSIPVFFIALVPPVLVIILLFFSRNNNKMKLKESNLIFPSSILGLLMYLFFVGLHARYVGETSPIFCIAKGFLGAYIGIAKYILLIYLTFQIRFRFNRNDEEIKTNIFSLFFLTIIIELICMFFYTPIVNRISYEEYGTLYGYKKYDYSRFMYSPFYMMFKYKNYGSLEGNNGFYPYMIIMLICFISVLVLEFFKNKRNNIISIILLSISIIVLIVGSIDFTSSFMAHYTTIKSTNYFNCISMNLFIFILLIGALMFIRVIQVLDINFIKKTNSLINVDEYVKEHEKKEIDL